jgi:hypothetical protein
MKKLGKTFRSVEFDGSEMSEKAFNVYSNSDFCVWRDLRGTFYVSDNEAADPIEIGSLLAIIDDTEDTDNAVRADEKN